MIQLRKGFICKNTILPDLNKIRFKYLHLILIQICFYTLLINGYSQKGNISCSNIIVHPDPGNKYDYWIQIDQVNMDYSYSGYITNPNDQSILTGGFWNDGKYTCVIRLTINNPVIHYKDKTVPFSEIKDGVSFWLKGISADIYSGNSMLNTVVFFGGIESLSSQLNESNVIEWTKHFNVASKEEVLSIFKRGWNLSNLNPKLSIASITWINTYLDELVKKETCEGIIKAGDLFYQQGDYENALKKYNETYLCSSYPGIQDKIAKSKEQLRLQKEQHQALKEEEERQNKAEAINNNTEINPPGNSSDITITDSQISNNSSYNQTEQKRIEEERKKQQTSQQIQNIQNKTENQAQNVYKATEEMLTGFDGLFQEHRSYQNYRTAMDKVTVITSTDPDEILSEYESKIRQIEQLSEQRKQQRMAELNQKVAQLKQQAQQNGGADASELVATIGNISIEKQIAREKENANKELREEKETAFKNIKNELNSNYISQKDQYFQKAAVCYDQGEEKYYLGWANYYECCYNYTKTYFSYENTRWVRPNCNEPTTKYFEKKYFPTADQLHQAAIRKSYVDNPYFQKAASDFIDMAIKLNPNVAEYYYSKSFYVYSLDDKYKLYVKILSLNPTHVEALDGYDWCRANKTATREAFSAYIQKHPNGNYSQTAYFNIEFFKNIDRLNNEISAKKLDDATITYNLVKPHELFNKKLVPNIGLLENYINKKEDEKAYQTALMKDIRNVKRENRISFYKEYLKNYPDGTYASTVEKRTKELQTWIDNNYFVMAIGIGAAELSESQNRPKVLSYSSGFYRLINAKKYSEYSCSNFPLTFECNKTGTFAYNLLFKYDLNFRYEFSFLGTDESDSVNTYISSGNYNGYPQIKTNISAINGTIGLWYKNYIRVFLSIEQNFYQQKVSYNGDISDLGDDYFNFIFKKKLCFISPGISLALPKLNDRKLSLIFSINYLENTTTNKYNVDPITGAYYLDDYTNNTTTPLVRIINSAAEDYTPGSTSAFYITNRLSGFDSKIECMGKKPDSRFFFKGTIGYMFLKNSAIDNYIPFDFETYNLFYIKLLVGLSF